MSPNISIPTSLLMAGFLSSCADTNPAVSVVEGGSTASAYGGSPSADAERLTALAAAASLEDDDPAPSAAGRTALIEAQQIGAPKEKSAFASLMGSVLETAVGVTSVAANAVAQNPQMLTAGRASRSSGDALAIQQVAVASSQPSSPTYRGGVASTQKNTGTPQPVSDTTMLGPSSLGAAKGCVSVVIDAKLSPTGRAIIPVGYLKKYHDNIIRSFTGSITARGTVFGFDKTGKLQQCTIDITFFSDRNPANTPVFFMGYNDFSRGIKSVQLTRILGKGGELTGQESF